MSDHKSSEKTRDESQAGVYYALVAFCLWALNPLFFKLLSHVSPFEVVAHRVLWSVPVGLALVLVLARTSDMKRVFKNPKLMVRLLLTGVLVSGNWLLFVWSVSNDLTLEASLGYFINPLFNVIIGYALLGERLSIAQVIAVGLAAIGVLIQTIGAGVFPWVAMILAVLFATYGYFRKTIDVGPVQGFVIETALLLPFGLGYILWLIAQGTSQFAGTTDDTILLMLCGPVTAIPLILFASAAKRLRLSTVGLLQYIVPTGMFLTAIFIFKEPAGVWKLMGFGFIWAALAIYSFDALRQDRKARKAL